MMKIQIDVFHPDESLDMPHMRTPRFIYSCWILYGCCAISIGSTIASAQDKVTFQPETGSSLISMVGQITDYSGDTLVLVPPNNSPRKIPTAAIESIETQYVEEHLQGLEAFRQHDTQRALDRFQAALKKEHRTWVDREILSFIVRCAQRQQSPLRALMAFQEIVNTDPETRHWDVAPLVWIPTAISEDLQGMARQWLIGKNRFQQLFGASLLLMDPEYGKRAEAVLNDLARDVNPRISALGKCQLWRLTLANSQVSALTLDSWKQDVERLPKELRNGPQYLVGSGYAVRQENRKAAAEFLWIPLVYYQNEGLSARAMMEAAEAMERTGLIGEAELLYRELQQRYGWSQEAGIARTKLGSKG